MTKKRPPVVVIMGHVDHGKTTLLDYIRKANVAAKAAYGEPRSITEREAGGITQSIGAYEIAHRVSGDGDRVTKEEKITFIDTPGHEAFMKMRQRGATIADIGILVVAADDSVQNQTKEAFQILQESQTPIIVAINKIDRPSIDINRVKSDLASTGILLEGYGGTISWQAISAKTGEGIKELLDLILLTAELENLSYDPDASVEGFILESRMDSRRGVVATAIIKNGKLKKGDGIFSPSASGKIKILENFLGKKIDEAVPSMPILVLGFERLPAVGEIFTNNFRFPADATPSLKASEMQSKALAGRQISDLELTKQEIEYPKQNYKSEIINHKSKINLILKADTSGSLEALSQIIKNLPVENSKLVILNELIGDITDGDVKSAIASKAIILGFKTKILKSTENLARANSVNIIKSEIVYDLVKAIEEYLKNFGAKKVLGELEILAVFGSKGKKQIIGGKVTSGEIKNNGWLEIQRGEQVIGKGKVVNLQQKKADSKTVAVDNECGLLFDTEVEVRVGDVLISNF